MSAKSLSPEENQRVREALIEWMKRERLSQAEIGARLGISQETISRFLGGGQGTSYRTAEKVAKALGQEVALILEGAAERTVQPTARYSNMEKAIEAAKLLDIDQEAIEAVRSTALNSDEDLHPQAWFEQIQAEATRLKLIKRGQKRLGVRVVDDDKDL